MQGITNKRRVGAWALAAAVVALRVTNTRGEEQQPSAQSAAIPEGAHA